MKYSLQHVLMYQNKAVLDRYRRDYPDNTMPAEEAFKQLLQYLWLAKQHEHERKAHPDREDLQFLFGMQPEMHEIDDMWHTFLMFTRDYMDFCHQFFGEFIHHVPKTDADILPPEQAEIELERYLSYMYDHLGEETLRIWFAAYFTE